MKNDSAAKVHMASLEDLLGIREPVTERTARTGDVPEQGQVVRIQLKKLHTFHSHAQGHPLVCLMMPRWRKPWKV